MARSPSSLDAADQLIVLYYWATPSRKVSKCARRYLRILVIEAQPPLRWKQFTVVMYPVQCQDSNSIHFWKHSISAGLDIVSSFARWTPTIWESGRGLCNHQICQHSEHEDVAARLEMFKKKKARSTWVGTLSSSLTLEINLCPISESGSFALIPQNG